MKKCLECDSENIIENVLVLDQDGGSGLKFRIAIDQAPSAFIFKERIYSDVTAKVCADCGYISFYAVDLQSLISADQNREK